MKKQANCYLVASTDYLVTSIGYIVASVPTTSSQQVSAANNWHYTEIVIFMRSVSSLTFLPNTETKAWYSFNNSTRVIELQQSTTWANNLKL